MWDYTEKVMDHFLNPRNVGEIKDADAVGVVGNITCGDALKLFLKLDDEKKKIVDAKFQTFGCASAIASSSALTEMIIGMDLESANRVTNNDIADFLGDLPQEKMHCSVMGMEALQAALAELRGEVYEAQDHDHSQHEDYDPDGLDRVVCTCFGVTERKIREVIKENNLTTVDEVTHYCKAGGGCKGCLEDIEELMNIVLGRSPQRSCGSGCNQKNQKKLTNLQRMELIKKSIDEVIRPGLRNDGGDLELIDIDGNRVIVRLIGRCAACASSQLTLKNWVQAKLNELVDSTIVVEREA